MSTQISKEGKIVEVYESTVQKKKCKEATIQTTSDNNEKHYFIDLVADRTESASPVEVFYIKRRIAASIQGAQSYSKIWLRAAEIADIIVVKKYATFYDTLPLGAVNLYLVNMHVKMFHFRDSKDIRDVL
ncbi:hypothetical protein RF11_13642 [Thelohanellus kitauei]|uniref:Uncharacterized protein n=1 Tax=Thelohanellus kitauei TaxID=669202 RepID=A0A0C2J7A0_THEKT|nr:hypothetical protein RF11_13642 [Thelohanellus kitauei]